MGSRPVNLAIRFILEVAVLSNRRPSTKDRPRQQRVFGCSYRGGGTYLFCAVISTQRPNTPHRA
jgi:hypothetical protein